jgi:hypothetical protein
MNAVSEPGRARSARGCSQRLPGALSVLTPYPGACRARFSPLFEEERESEGRKWRGLGGWRGTESILSDRDSTLSQSRESQRVRGSELRLCFSSSFN